jgi:hypothetical protein
MEPTDGACQDQAHYQIHVRGHLHPRWSAAFGGLTITHQPDGTSTLAGPVADQAALYGLLRRARDLGLTLLAVSRVEPDAVDSDPEE